MSEESAIIAANAAFYAAFTTGNLDDMIRLWADSDDISCTHPGWPALIGQAAVMESWREILQNPARPLIACAEPTAIINGESGRVLCIEIVDGMALAATNLFRRIDGRWHMVHHQSSQIAQIVAEAPPQASGRSVH